MKRTRNESWLFGVLLARSLSACSSACSFIACCFAFRLVPRLVLLAVLPYRFPSFCFIVSSNRAGIREGIFAVYRDVPIAVLPA